MANVDLVARLSGQDNLTPTLNNVKKSINDLSNQGDKLKGIQDRFNNIQKSSAPLTKKVSDIRKEMLKLAEMGQGGSPLFKQMAEQAKALKAQIKEVNKALGDVNDNMNGFGGNWGNIMTKVAGQAGFGGLASSLTTLINPTTAMIAGGALVAKTFYDAGKAASDFEVHLDQLQSLTGLSNEEMKSVSDGAIEMSKEFKSSAGEIVDAMKIIGSQAPELLKNKDALMAVTEAANVLSEAALIPVEESAKAITGVMNQMGASSAEVSDIINVLAAASQQGAGDVAYLNKAFEKAGTNAKSAGMSYVELAAAVETIAPKFSSADVAGSQLNATLLKLSMSGNSDFMPSVVGMSKALENLAKAEMDDAEMKKLVGESNVTMLKSLIEGREQFDAYSDSLRGTQTAYEQMAINSDNLEGYINRLKSAWDAFLLTLGQSGIIQGVLDNIMLVMNALGEVINVVSDVIKAFEEFQIEGTDNINIFAKQVEFLKDVIKGIGTVLEIVVRLVAKAFNEIKSAVENAGNAINEKWEGVKKSLMDIAFVRTLVNGFQTILNKASEMIAKVKKLWNDFLKWLGMETKSEVQEAVTLTPTVVEEEVTTTGGGGSTGSSGSSGKTKKTKTTKEKEVGEAGSIKAMEDRVSEINKELTNKNVSEEVAKQLNEEKKTLEEQIKVLKKRNGLLESPEDGSLKALKDRVGEIDKELNTKNNSQERIDSLLEEKKQLQDTIKEEEKKLKIYDFEKGSLADLKQRQSELAKELNDTNVSDARRKEIQAECVEIGKEIELLQKRNEQSTMSGTDYKRKVQSDSTSKVSQLQSDVKLGIIGSDEAMNEIAKINEELEALGLKKIDIHVNAKGQLETAQEELEAFNKKMDEVSGMAGNVGNAFGALGSAIGGTGGEMLNFAGQTISAIGQIIPQIVSLIAAQNAEAIAAGTASGAAMPFPANIGAIMSIVATIAGIFASLPKFETGGIVGGTTYFGDRQLVRANAGEMILTPVQQGNLFDMINSGNVGANLGGRVSFEIDGTKLKGVLNNFDKKMKRQS